MHENMQEKEEGRGEKVRKKSSKQLRMKECK